jgi:glycosyltransferase involved in cell wall biosynthesis
LRNPIIALDATYGVEHPRHPLTGVGVYSREMLRGLAAAHAEARFRWCYRAHRLWLGVKEAKPVNASARPLFDGLVPGCDLFHGLNQRLPAKRPRRTVCTFHDLFVMSSDSYSSAEFRKRFTQQSRDAAGRADLIIAVSEFTAGQVESLLGVERARIRVVHHGVHMPLKGDARRQPMILSVGALQTRKNTVRLVEAFESIDAPEWRLVLVGSQGYGAPEAVTRIARSPRRELITVRGFVSDDERQQLYREASIFAFPSLDEGFGMPVLEAMSNGTPVLTSSASSLPEVAGDAAVLVDPHDANAIAAGLQRLVDDAALRERLGAAGVERARVFSWDTAIERTWAVYQELIARQDEKDT